MRSRFMEEVALVKKIVSEFEKISNLSAAFPPEIISQLTQGVSAVTLTDQFAQYFPLQVAAKQKLLETVNINERMSLRKRACDSDERRAGVQRRSPL